MHQSKASNPLFAMSEFIVKPVANISGNTQTSHSPAKGKNRWGAQIAVWPFPFRILLVPGNLQPTHFPLNTLGTRNNRCPVAERFKRLPWLIVCSASTSSFGVVPNSRDSKCTFGPINTPMALPYLCLWPTRHL